jgi:ribulose-5-phosphate 4-epimerase/fuculose-1-phosphate aldolase
MLQDAVWVAKALFDRNKVSGSSANLSFRFDNRIYITGSGTCFGRLRADSFSGSDIEGQHRSGISPSKEVPLHRRLYGKDPAIKAVVPYA